jgi:hypothetical protein
MYVYTHMQPHSQCSYLQPYQHRAVLLYLPPLPSPPPPALCCRRATLTTLCLVLLTSWSTWCTLAAGTSLMRGNTRHSWQHMGAAATHQPVCGCVDLGGGRGVGGVLCVAGPVMLLGVAHTCYQSSVHALTQQPLKLYPPTQPCPPGYCRVSLPRDAPWHGAHPLPPEGACLNKLTFQTQPNHPHTHTLKNTPTNTPTHPHTHPHTQKHTHKHTHL